MFAGNVPFLAESGTEIADHLRVHAIKQDDQCAQHNYKILEAADSLLVDEVGDVDGLFGHAVECNRFCNSGVEQGAQARPYGFVVLTLITVPDLWA